MKRSRSPSRDDFPLNAFVLLQPLVVDDSGASGDHAPVPVVPEDPVEVEESGGQGDDPMVLLKLNLAHTELRETIDTLYHAMEAQEKEIAVVRAENTRLSERHERVKADAVAAVEKMREKLQARDHELMQLQQHLRETERQKERIGSELVEKQLKLEEQDSVIAALEETVRKLQKEHERLSHVTGREAELRCMVDMWTSKERAVAENTEHVRAATTGVHQLAGQLLSQLKQVESELLTTEKDHKAFRDYLAEHKCSEHIDLPTSGDVNSYSHEEYHEVMNRASAFENEKIEAATEIQVLRTKCAEFKKSIRVLSTQIEQARATEDATHKLIVKYQESAVDGTQTIAELQDSLVKLCDQLANERKEHADQHCHQMRSALELETSLRQELNRLGEELRDANQNRDAARETPSVVPKSICSRCASSHQPVSQRSSKPTSEERATDPGLLSPPPSRLQNVTTPQAQHTIGKSGAVEDMMEQAIESAERIETPTREKLSRDRLVTREDNKQSVSCRLCEEEPFGFMVRCQKCKDAFHAGCVKNNGSGAKKRLGHIFKCSNCAPHRPTKVARSSTGIPFNLEDGGAQRQRSGAPPLQVTPSRNAGVTARPAVSSNNP